MIKPINFEKPVEYILPEEKKEKKPTVWLFKNLLLKEEEFLKSVAIEASRSEDPIAYHKALPVFLHVALEGAKNWGGDWKRDEKAECVYGDTKPWSEKTLLQISQKHRDQLSAFVINGYTDLSEEEAKN